MMQVQPSLIVFLLVSLFAIPPSFGSGIAKEIIDEVSTKDDFPDLDFPRDKNFAALAESRRPSRRPYPVDQIRELANSLNNGLDDFEGQEREILAAAIGYLNKAGEELTEENHQTVLRNLALGVILAKPVIRSASRERIKYLDESLALDDLEPWLGELTQSLADILIIIRENGFAEGYTAAAAYKDLTASTEGKSVFIPKPAFDQATATNAAIGQIAGRFQQAIRSGFYRSSNGNEEYSPYFAVDIFYWGIGDTGRRDADDSLLPLGGWIFTPEDYQGEGEERDRRFRIDGFASVSYLDADFAPEGENLPDNAFDASVIELETQFLVPFAEFAFKPETNPSKWIGAGSIVFRGAISMAIDDITIGEGDDAVVLVSESDFNTEMAIGGRASFTFDRTKSLQPDYYIDVLFPFHSERLPNADVMVDARARIWKTKLFLTMRAYFGGQAEDTVRYGLYFDTSIEDFLGFFAGDEQDAEN